MPRLISYRFVLSCLVLFCFRFTGALPTIVKTFAGGYYFTGYENGDGATKALFNNPRGMALHFDAGILYVADQDNNKIRTIDMYGSVNILNLAEQPVKPYGLIYDKEGHGLYITGGGYFKYFPISGGIQATQFIGPNTYFPDDPDSINSTRTPYALYFDRANQTLYFSENSYSALRSWKYPFTNISEVRTLWKNASTNSNSWGFVVDSSGNAYIGQNSQIINVFPNGTSTVFSGGAQGYRNGNSTTAQFRIVEGLAWDSSKEFFYVADQGNSLIRKVYLNGSAETLVGSTAAFSFREGTNANATFPNCAEIYPHPFTPDYFFIADSFGIRVWYGGPPILASLKLGISGKMITVSWVYGVPYNTINQVLIVINYQPAGSPPKNISIAYPSYGMMMGFTAIPYTSYNVTVTPSNEFGSGPPAFARMDGSKVLPPPCSWSVSISTKPSSCLRVSDGSASIKFSTPEIPSITWTEEFVFNYRWSAGTQVGFPVNTPPATFVYARCATGIKISQDNSNPKPYLFIPYSSVLTKLNSDFVIAFWYKGTTVGPSQALLSQRDACVKGNSWSFYLVDNKLHFDFNRNLELKAAETINSDQWYHFAATNSLGNVTLYINGIPQQSFQLNNTALPNLKNLTLGWDLCNTGGYFENAFFDDLVVGDSFFDPANLFSYPCALGKDIASNVTTVSNLRAAIYKLTINNSMCTPSQMVSFTVAASINTTNITSVQVKNATCHGKSDGSINVSLSGDPFPVYWYTPNQTLVAIGNYAELPAGLYYAKSGCSGRPIFAREIEQPEELTVSTIFFSCEKNNCTLILNITGGVYPTFIYVSQKSGVVATQGINTITSLENTQYDLEVSDSCTKLDFVIGEWPPAKFSYIPFIGVGAAFGVLCGMIAFGFYLKRMGPNNPFTLLHKRFTGSHSSSSSSDSDHDVNSSL